MHSVHTTMYLWKRVRQKIWMACSYAAVNSNEDCTTRRRLLESKFFVEYVGISSIHHKTGSVDGCFAQMTFETVWCGCDLLHGCVRLHIMAIAPNFEHSLGLNCSFTNTYLWARPIVPATCTAPHGEATLSCNSNGSQSTLHPKPAPIECPETSSTEAKAAVPWRCGSLPIRQHRKACAPPVASNKEINFTQRANWPVCLCPWAAENS